MFEVYIPTKGRAGNLYLNRLIEVINNRVTLVIEPQEFNSYYDLYKDKVNYIKLDKDNMGICYSANHIYNMIYTNKQKAFIIDDDIANIYRKYVGGKRETCGIESINEAMEFVASTTPYAVTGLVFKQHIWLCETEYIDFGRPSAFVFIKGEVLDTKVFDYFHKYDIIKYRLLSDVMFASSVLYSGLKIGMCGKYGFTTPDMAKTKGGCFNDYQTDQQSICSKEIHNIVGNNFSSLIERRGRTEVKVAWKSLYQSRIKTKQNKLF